MVALGAPLDFGRGITSASLSSSKKSSSALSFFERLGGADGWGSSFSTLTGVGDGSLNFSLLDVAECEVVVVGADVFLDLAEAKNAFGSTASSTFTGL